MAERLSEAEREALAAEAEAAVERACEERGRGSWAALSPTLRETLVRDVRGWALTTVPAVEALIAARLAPIEALAEACELYDKPGQDCITAGPEMFAADGCMPCRLRAALAASREENTDAQAHRAP